MTVIPLISTNQKTVIDNKITAGDTTDSTNYAKVFSGTAAATSITMTKKGDIYVKTDTPHVYIAKGTTKASDWVQVD